MKGEFSIPEPKVRYWLDALLQRGLEVIAPVETEHGPYFQPIRSGEEAQLRGKNPILPPKEYFYPRNQVLFTYKKRKGAITVTPPPAELKERVLFGIRPYDAWALHLMDHELQRTGQPEVLYQQNRERTTLVGLADLEPGPVNFSASVGTGPLDERPLDMLFVPMGKDFYVRVQTDRGMALVDENFADAQPHQREEFERLKERLDEQCQYPLNLERWQKYELMEIYSLPYWEEVYLTCIECGACTFVCPTSWNARLVDEDREDGGVRYRVWDASMWAHYQALPRGPHPLPSLKDRFRDWVLEKFLYFPMRHELINCVGCGRGSEACPAKIDFRKVVGDMRFE